MKTHVEARAFEDTFYDRIVTCAWYETLWATKYRFDKFTKLVNIRQTHSQYQEW